MIHPELLVDINRERLKDMPAPKQHSVLAKLQRHHVQTMLK